MIIGRSPFAMSPYAKATVTFGFENDDFTVRVVESPSPNRSKGSLKVNEPLSGFDELSQEGALKCEVSRM
jgi:hypothetical protein